MEGLVVWSCLAILMHFHGVLCDEHPLVNRESINDERIKRYHESDYEKLRARHELNESPKANTPTQKPKTPPKPVIKQKLPINERNEPKNVKVINHILEEIASVAHNHNQSKGINKIRHLVDEIDKQNEIEGHESKHDKEKLASIDKVVKTLKKEEEKATGKVILTNQIANETKSTVTPEKNNQQYRAVNSLEIELPKKTICLLETEKISDVKVGQGSEKTSEVKPLLTNQRSELDEKTSSNAGNSKKQNLKDENLIEIEEHTYEEESFRTPCKYTQPNTYNNGYTKQDYKPGFYTDYYTDYGNNYYGNCYPIQSYQTTYPSTYGEYDGGTDYANYYDNTQDLVKPVTNQRNDYVRQRETWLDRDTIIDVKDPNQYQVKTINEDKQEITSIHRPDFHRKYYSITQKQYSSDVSKNQNMYYYKDPYHCS